jgi:hypothetical protein
MHFIRIVRGSMIGPVWSAVPQLMIPEVLQVKQLFAPVCQTFAGRQTV